MPELFFPATLLVCHACQTLTRIDGHPASKDFGQSVIDRHSAVKQESSHGYPHRTEIRTIDTLQALAEQGLSSYTIIEILTVTA